MTPGDRNRLYQGYIIYYIVSLSVFENSIYIVPVMYPVMQEVLCIAVLYTLLLMYQSMDVFGNVCVLWG